MPLETGEGLGEIVVQAVDGVLLHSGGAAEKTVFHQKLPQALAQLRVIGDLLSDDVAGARQRVLRGLYAFLRVDILGRGLQGLRAVRSLGEEEICQGFQSALLRYGGPGAALLLVGAVQVFHLCQGLCAVNGGGQLLRQLALVSDGGLHRLPPLLKAPKVLKPLFQGSEGGVVHGAMEFLAVTGNEGNGVSLVQEAHHVFHVFRPLVQLLGNL